MQYGWGMRPDAVGFVLEPLEDTTPGALTPAQELPQELADAMLEQRAQIRERLIVDYRWLISSMFARVQTAVGELPEPIMGAPRVRAACAELERVSREFEQGSRTRQEARSAVDALERALLLQAALVKRSSAAKGNPDQGGET